MKREELIARLQASRDWHKRNLVSMTPHSVGYAAHSEAAATIEAALAALQSEREAVVRECADPTGDTVASPSAIGAIRTDFDPSKMKTDTMLQPLGGKDCVTGERIEVVHVDDCRKIELRNLELARDLAKANNELAAVMQTLGEAISGEGGLHIGDALDMAKRVKVILAAPIAPRVEAEAISPWISVKDRLPFAGDYVIVQGGCGYISREGVWFTLMEGSPHRPIQWEVTHWMPLPDGLDMKPGSQ